MHVAMYTIYEEGVEEGYEEEKELCDDCAGYYDCEAYGPGDVCEECGATNDED